MTKLETKVLAATIALLASTLTAYAGHGSGRTIFDDPRCPMLIQYCN